MKRRERYQQTLENRDRIGTDAVFSGICEMSRETLGAVLEGINTGIDGIIEKTTRKDKANHRLSKSRRYINRQGIHRVLRLVGTASGTIGNLGITALDTINNASGSLHDTFRADGRITSRSALGSATRGLGDTLWRKAIKDGLRNSVILNKKLPTDFDARSTRNPDLTSATKEKKNAKKSIQHPASTPQSQAA